MAGEVGGWTHVRTSRRSRGLVGCRCCARPRCSPVMSTRRRTWSRRRWPGRRSGGRWSRPQGRPRPTSGGSSTPGRSTPGGGDGTNPTPWRSPNGSGLGAGRGRCHRRPVRPRRGLEPADPAAAGGAGAALLRGPHRAGGCRGARLLGQHGEVADPPRPRAAARRSPRNSQTPLAERRFVDEHAARRWPSQELVRDVESPRRSSRRGALDQGRPPQGQAARARSGSPGGLCSSSRLRRLAVPVDRLPCRHAPAGAGARSGHLPVGDRPPLLRAGRTDRPPTDERRRPRRGHRLWHRLAGQRLEGACRSHIPSVCRAVAQRSLDGRRRARSTTSSPALSAPWSSPGRPTTSSSGRPGRRTRRTTRGPTNRLETSWSPRPTAPGSRCPPDAAGAGHARQPGRAAGGWTSRTLMVTYPSMVEGSLDVYTWTMGDSSWRASGRLFYPSDVSLEPAAAVSPDGRTLAFGASRWGHPQRLRRADVGPRGLRDRGRGGTATVHLAGLPTLGRRLHLARRHAAW